MWSVVVSQEMTTRPRLRGTAVRTAAVGSVCVAISFLGSDPSVPVRYSDTASDVHADGAGWLTVPPRRGCPGRHRGPVAARPFTRMAPAR
ncbi:hypothetical protein GCM10010238_60830 [Streptomyces griseoviridis]|uniref:Uncharacterized protein n=1 Tax=Streptomyces griseoviridis TaxID=45398 RepID=A0A918LKW6_STRGD|nr:hypothetical protein GCM10010238_60830 [Streptomyces niveoruber]